MRYCTIAVICQDAEYPAQKLMPFLRGGPEWEVKCYYLNYFWGDLDG
jgi:hypothetical protein